MGHSCCCCVFCCLSLVRTHACLPTHTRVLAKLASRVKEFIPLHAMRGASFLAALSEGRQRSRHARVRSLARSQAPAPFDHRDSWVAQQQGLVARPARARRAAVERCLQCGVVAAVHCKRLLLFVSSGDRHRTPAESCVSARVVL